MITSSEYVAYDRFPDRQSIYHWLNNKNATVYSNRDDYRTVINHQCDYKEQHQYVYGKKHNKKLYQSIFAHYLEIMIPNNLSDEQKHTFINKYMITVNPCFKSNSYLYCYKFTSKGNGTYIEVLCFTRKYFKRKQCKTVTYTRDYYFNPFTKKLTTADDPDAVLKYKKGEAKKDKQGNVIKEDYYVSPTEKEIFKYRSINGLRQRLVKHIQYVKLLLNRSYWQQQIKYFSRVTVKKSSYKSKEKISVRNHMIARINSLINDMQTALYQSKLWYDVEHSFYKLIRQLDLLLYKSHWHDDVSNTNVYLGTKQSLTSVKDNMILFEEHINELLKTWWSNEVSDEENTLFINKKSTVSPVKVLIDSGDYWMDGYRNKWSKSRYTYDQAVDYSHSLINCHNCTDCLDCIECTNCHNCISCRSCLNCTDCYECISCIEQENIYKCQQYAGVTFTAKGLVNKLEWNDNLVYMRLRGVI